MAALLHAITDLSVKKPNKLTFMKCFHKFLQIFCIVPASENSLLIYYLQKIFAIVLVCFVTITNYVEMFWRRRSYSFIKKIFWMCGVSLNCISTICIIFATMFGTKYRQISYKKQLQKFSKLSDIFKEWGMDMKEELDNHCKAILKRLSFILTIGFIIIGSVMCAVIKIKQRSVVVYVGYMIIPNILIFLTLSQYWLALNILHFLYTLGNKSLLHWQKYPEKRTASRQIVPTTVWYFKEFHNFKSNHLSHFMTTFGHFQLQLDGFLKDIFNDGSLILTLNCLTTIFSISLRIFGSYQYLDNPESYQAIDLLHHLAILYMHVWRLIFILIPHTTIVEERIRTIFILHKLSVKSLAEESSINKLSTQLMVRQEAESIYDVYQPNLMLLGGVTSVLLMCVMFLIQTDLEAIIDKTETGDF